MNNMKALLAERKVPDLLAGAKTVEDWRLRRKEILYLLRHEVYGISPHEPEHVSGEVLSKKETYGGKATIEKISVSFDTPGGKYAFPFTLVAPTGKGKAPVFVFFNFRPEVPDEYFPAEEIIDRGFAVAMIYYNDVTTDGNAQQGYAWDGIAAMYPRDENVGWGKIGMWAFAGSRALDYLETRADIDAGRAAVVGHSRLGKTALWCGAQDERFSMVISNDSGCAGAAISRGKVGETIEDITKMFPCWFCGNYGRWADREGEATFDQHMLLSLVAPRALYVASSSEDLWADPASEYLGCVAAEDAWHIFRVPGFLAPDRLPEADDSYDEGSIGYHQRRGSHFLSRTDWLHFLAYREKHNI